MQVKLAAAYCLGHAAAGDMSEFLAVILTSLAGPGPGTHQYLLLAALRDVISVHSHRDLDFKPYVSAVLPVLLRQCAEGPGQADSPAAVSQSADERCVHPLPSLLPPPLLLIVFVFVFVCVLNSVRNIVAECLGLLLSMTAAVAAEVLPVLLSMLGQTTSLRVGRQTIASAFKVALSKNGSPAAAVLQEAAPIFLPPLRK